MVYRFLNISKAILLLFLLCFSYLIAKEKDRRIIPIGFSKAMLNDVDTKDTVVAIREVEQLIGAVNSISYSVSGSQILSLLRSEGVLNFDCNYLIEISKMFLKYSAINK